MFIKEVPFTILRKTYTEVRDFVVERIGVERNEVGLYSAIDSDLGCCDEDFDELTDKFIAEFGVQINEPIYENTLEIKPRTWQEFWSMLPFFMVLASIVAVCYLSSIIGSILLISLAFLSQYHNTTLIPIPSKKTWQASESRQDELCVGDLVCMALEKKGIRKQDIHYILPAQLAC